MGEGKFTNTGLEVETSRLRLRPMSPDDLDGLAALYSDADVLRYLSPPKPIERPEVEILLQSMISHWERHGFGRMAIIHKETGEMIGFSGLRTLEGTPEIVYAVAKQYWGEGLATEAAKASLRLGFENFQFERIAAITHPENWVSRHILNKIGLCFQGEANHYGHTVAYYEIVRRHYLPDENFFCRIVQEQIPNILFSPPSQTSPQVF